MRLTSTSTALRGTFAALAAAAVVTTLSACGGAEEPADEQTDPATSESSEAPESTESTETEAPEGDSSSASGEVCTAEQMSTIAAASGQAVDDAAMANATGEFAPAEVIGDLTSTCLVHMELQGVEVSFAVLPGGTATLDTLESNLTAAGATPTEAQGMLTGTVGEQQIVAAPFTAVTQETAGFEDVDDLVVVAATPPLG